MKKSLFYLSLLIGMAITGCQKEVSQNQANEEIASVSSANANFINTFYGPQVQLGDGKVRSWIRVSRENVPLELGLEFTADALQNLPQPPAGVTTEYTFDYTIPLHQKAKELTPYDHLEVDWQPNGHPPPGIFTIPHFDIHFYMIPESLQMTIPGPTATNGSLFVAPPAGYLPADFVIPGAIVPQMGRHWLDRTSPVFPPTSAPFTHVWIYGSYDAKVIFSETMITRAFLLSGTTLHTDIKQPTYYSPTETYYPTRYNIYTDPATQKVYVTLDQFVWR